jgi:hypothetical protein
MTATERQLMNTPVVQSEPSAVPVRPSTSNGAPIAPRRDFGPRELAFLVGVPLLWGILLLFHPGGEGTEVYVDLQDNVTRWLVVHIGMLIFIPLMAIVVYVLLRGVEGTAARISRIALVPYVVFYGAFETLQGIGNGVLVNALNGLPQVDEATRADLVQDFAEHALVRDMGVFSSIGVLAFVTAMIAAGVALRRAGAPLAVPALLALSGFLIPAHPPPFGPTGLALFIAAALIYVRSQAELPRPALAAARGEA